MSDRYEMNDKDKKVARSLESDGELYIRSYSDLLRDAKKFNEEFIKKFEEVKEAYQK